MGSLFFPLLPDPTPGRSATAPSPQGREVRGRPRRYGPGPGHTTVGTADVGTAASLVSETH